MPRPFLKIDENKSISRISGENNFVDKLSDKDGCI
jgi:hypothetical protein